MAEMEFDAYEASEGPAKAGLISRMMNWVGAGSSVALVIGLGVWGYQLTVRDVTDVPVIRALEGPARVQAENPGGQLAEHQGLAVNNLQAVGEAEGPTPQVILAPEPIDLTEEDISLATPVETETATEIRETVVSLTTETTTQEADPTAQALALVEQLAEGIEPLEAPSVDETNAVEVAVAAALASSGIDPSIPGVKKSPRPGLRPQVDLASVQDATPVSAAPAVAPATAGVDVDPSTIVAGTRLVQLGAFDDVETAKVEWDKISSRFEDYLDGKGRLIQEAASGGRKFYRLRAVGFDDLNASRRFCAVLVAANAACIPVLAR